MSNGRYHLRAPSGRRMVLSEAVPLLTPLCIRIEPAEICNFRCEYCPMSQISFREGLSHQLMDFDSFLSIVNDIKLSFGRVKTIMLVGMGESLLHPRIADMVAEIASQNIADVVEITTNGALLEPSMSDALVAAGLSLIRISVNGLSDRDFHAHCGVKIDFGKYVQNIAYLFSHKGKTRVYVKIINYMVQKPEDYDKFVNTFEPISDIISVENLIKASPNIDYEGIGGEGISFNQTQSNTDLMQTKICSMPFYTLHIAVNGDVCPCCTAGVPPIGNIKRASLKDIWEKNAILFQQKMLDGVDRVPFCNSCTSMQYRVYPEDVLDARAAILKDQYDVICKTKVSK